MEILEADPKTDWSRVDIDALRQPLTDMRNVTLTAEARPVTVEGGLRFVVTGTSDIKPSICRMLLAHAKIMNGVGG